MTLLTKEQKERRDKARIKFAHKIYDFLKENDLENTIENVRRYFALKYPNDMPSEKSIEAISDLIDKMQRGGIID